MILEVTDVMTFTLSIFIILFCMCAFWQAIYLGIHSKDRINEFLIVAFLYLLVLVDAIMQIILSMNVVYLIENGEVIKNFIVFLAVGTSLEALFYDRYIITIKRMLNNKTEEKQRKKLITNWAIALITVHLILFWYLWPLWKKLYQILL